MNRVFVLLAISLMLGACAPTATQSAAPASTPTREGQYYETSDFAITLPPDWRIFDPTKDRQTLQSELNSLPPEQRRAVELVLQRYKYRLVAFQFEGVSMLNLAARRLGQSFSLNDLCHLLKQAFRQERLEVLEAQCNINLGGNRAHRFTVEFSDGYIQVRAYQYAFLRQGDEIWLLTLGTIPPLWESKRAVFEAIAATFRLR